MSGSPHGDFYSMSPDAKRWAIRLLLRDFDRLNRDEGRELERPHSASVRALRAALANLNGKHPKRHALVLWCMRQPEKLSANLECAFCDTIDWLAKHMPLPIAVPEARNWDWENGDYRAAVRELGKPVVEELVEAWREAEARLAEREDEDVDDDPDASPAPAPLTVIAPRRASGPLGTGPVGEHPQCGSKQYKEACEAQPKGPVPLSEDESQTMALVFGDGWGARGGIFQTGNTGAPPGRPRRGTKEPVKAESLIVELCPGQTIEDLRACLRPGKPRAGAKGVRAQLAAAIFQIVRDKRATAEALADALGCSVRTIHRLAAPPAASAVAAQPVGA